MSDVFNVVAEGRHLFWSVSHDDRTPMRLRECIACREGNDFMRAFDGASKSNYYLSNVIAFGNDKDLRRCQEWVEQQQWKRPFRLFLLSASMEDILRSYSFLSIESNWQAETGFTGNLPHKIMHYLYLGDYSCATNPVIHESLGVHYIINASGFANEFEDHPQISYLNVNVWDTPSATISQHFESCIEFIDQARQNDGCVMVHCAAGISRSTTIVLAYLMVREKMSLRDAYILVRGIRSVVRPNSGFVKQLLQFEHQTLGRNSVYVPDSLPSYFGLGDLIRSEMERDGKQLDEHLRRILSD